jgi:hypothetical protein
VKEVDWFSKRFRYFGVTSNRIVAPPKPVCSPLPIWTNMVYIPTSAASNVVIVRIEVGFHQVL